MLSSHLGLEYLITTFRDIDTKSDELHSWLRYFIADFQYV